MTTNCNSEKNSIKNPENPLKILKKKFRILNKLIQFQKSPKIPKKYTKFQSIINQS